MVSKLQTIILLVLGVDGLSAALLGGIGDTRPASQANDKLLSAMATTIRQQFIDRVGFAPNRFELIEFATQIVAGVNYFTKVQISDDEYVHLRVFEPLPHTKRPMMLHGVQRGKTMDSPLEYIDIDFGTKAHHHNLPLSHPDVEEKKPNKLGGSRLLGGVGSARPASDASRDFLTELLTTIRRQFAIKTGEFPNIFELISFATQTVAGTNYFAKVRISDDEYVHMRIFSPLNALGMMLHSYQRGKSLESPIEYFDRTVETVVRSNNDDDDAPSIMLGGISSPRPASDANVELLHALTTTIRDEFANKAGVKPDRFDLISFATQVVAGTNYFAKVRISDDEYVHLRIYEPLPFAHKPMELSAYLLEKSLESPLEYFEETFDAVAAAAAGTVAEIIEPHGASVEAPLPLQEEDPEY